MPYVYITSFSGPPATITVCDTPTGTICYTHPTQLTDLGPFPFIINLPSPFDEVGGITLTAQSDNGCSIVDSTICSILPTPSPTSGPVPCFEVVINGDFNSNLSGWSASNPTYWTWDSFSGGSAVWTGNDGYPNELFQTGYTFIDGFSYTINYDVYNTDPLGGFVWAQLGVNTSIDLSQPIPISPVSAWTQYSTNLLCAGGTQLSMNGYSDILPVYLDNVSACFTYGPCYYMEFGTNENFGVLGTGEVQYLDCNGVLQTYSAATAGNFYLCAVQSPGSIDIDVIGEDYLCENVGGDWYGPILVSPTPTPSNPPTPTPTNPTTVVLGSVFYSANVPSGSQVKLTLNKSGAAYAFVNWGDGTVDTISALTMTKTHTYSSPYNGNIVISASTSVVGKVTSILNMELFSTNTSVSPKLTGFTSQYGKCPNLQTIDQQAQTYARLVGTTSDLSGCTNLTILEANLSNITGDIVNLPDSIERIKLSGKINSEPNFVNTLSGNISGLPTSSTYIQIEGNNTISGNVNSITSLTGWSSNSTLIIRGNNTIFGNMSDLPNIDTIRIWNNGDSDYQTTLNSYTGTTISGSLSLKTNHKHILIAGANTITGPLTATTVPTSLNMLQILGLNTINGNLNQLKVPNELFAIMGNNTISGSLQDMVFSNNATLNAFVIRQRNNSGGLTRVDSGTTITGNISVFSNTLSLDYLWLGGLNSVSGDLGILNNYNDNSFIVFAIVSAFNTINANTLYTNERKVQNYLLLNTNAAGLSSNHVNKVLQQMNADPVTSTMVINIKGNHSAPTAAGVTAKNNLISQGASVSTN